MITIRTSILTSVFSIRRREKKKNDWLGRWIKRFPLRSCGKSHIIRVVSGNHLRRCYRCRLQNPDGKNYRSDVISFKRPVSPTEMLIHFVIADDYHRPFGRYLIKHIVVEMDKYSSTENRQGLGFLDVRAGNTEHPTVWITNEFMPRNERFSINAKVVNCVSCWQEEILESFWIVI